MIMLRLIVGKHKTRFVYKSKVQEHVMQEVLLCGRADLVQYFHRANAFANKVTHKTYAQVVAKNLKGPMQ